MITTSTDQPERKSGSSFSTSLEHNSHSGPLVSVIMIFWNAEKFLQEAIHSVLNQTLQDYELLLVDDGSTDNSSVLAQQWADIDQRIRLLAHPGRQNRGTGESRNLGLQAARGQFISFLDSDDVYEPDRLSIHVNLLLRQPLVGSAISRECYWRQWAHTDSGSQSILPDHEVGPFAHPSTIIPSAAMLYSILATPGAPMPGICSITFRKHLLGSVGLIPNSFRDQYEDQVLIAKLLLAAPTWLLDACLARYRQHQGSLTSVARKEGAYCPGQPHLARDRYLSWLCEYLHQQGYWNAKWSKVLATQSTRPSGWRKKTLCSARLRQTGLQIAAFFPRRVIHFLIQQLWHIRDMGIRKRALMAGSQMENFLKGSLCEVTTRDTTPRT